MLDQLKKQQFVDALIKQNHVFSSGGNFLNFLRVKNTIILPEYNLPTKKETQYYNITYQETFEGLGFEVLKINCDVLTKIGAVLHCVFYPV